MILVCWTLIQNKLVWWYTSGRGTKCDMCFCGIKSNVISVCYKLYSSIRFCFWCFFKEIFVTSVFSKWRVKCCVITFNANYECWKLDATILSNESTRNNVLHIIEAIYLVNVRVFCSVVFVCNMYFEAHVSDSSW